MKVERVRSILGLLIVGTFMLITGIMALFPLFAGGNVDFDSYAGFFAKTASVYTGIVGVVIGYYFGRSEQSTEKQDRVD